MSKTNTRRTVEKIYKINKSIVDFDVTFIPVNSRDAPLVSKGMNLANKAKPYGTKLGLVQARNNEMPVPLMASIFRGGTAEEISQNAEGKAGKEYKGEYIEIS